MNTSLTFPPLPDCSCVSTGADAGAAPAYLIPLGCTRSQGPISLTCTSHISQLRGAHLVGEPALDRHAPQVCVTICTGEHCLHHMHNNPLWREK